MTSRRERLAGLLSATGLLRLFAAHPRWNGVLVLNYHRIGDPAASLVDRGVFSATADEFDAQVALLKTESDIVLPGDIAGLVSRPGRHVLLTFDDGYRDNYDLAFPILRAHGVEATFFLCTGFLDTRQIAWWDEIAWLIRTSPRAEITLVPWRTSPLALPPGGRDAAIRSVLALYKSLPAGDTVALLETVRACSGSDAPDPGRASDLWMTWDMAREMAAAGMEIGGHTVTHPVLTRLPEDAQQAEIDGGQERFLAELGRTARAFAYPVGSRDAFDATTKAAVARAGFDTAFGFYGGYARGATWDPYDIPRTHVSSDTTVRTIRALLAAPQLIAAPPRIPRRR